MEPLPPAAFAPTFSALSGHAGDCFVVGEGTTKASWGEEIGVDVVELVSLPASSRPISRKTERRGRGGDSGSREEGR